MNETVSKTVWLVVETLVRGKLRVIACLECPRRDADGRAAEIVEDGRGAYTVSIEQHARFA